MFRDFLQDSFFYTKRYYGYIFGLIVISALIVFLSFVILLILGILLAMFMGVDVSTVSLLKEEDIFPFLSNKLIFFIILMVILSLVWIFLVVTFIQYPLIKTFIEISRDKEVVKRPFSIYFEKMKEKNILMALKMFGLGLLLMLIVAPVLIVGIVCVARAPDIIDVLARFVVFAIGIAGFVLAIYLLLRLMFANSALIDKNLGILESIRESLKLTKGKMGFVIATALYSIIASMIFQIPLYIVGILDKTGSFHESFLFIILSLAAAILYFIAFPYFVIIQYLPYNMLNDVINKESNVESQEDNSNDFVVG
ncbi:hypothetical protein ELD05_12880 [Caldicellulosiruptor changbaiensis]|uniref:Glycerophosphoryl diester phosphodiesterase membrane domain-containing protein n=1 Tax=Caldicellulosiruptor changbaiensis TaxID=1222016 RepID=A0A3T0D8C4_9FIRM|nr:hypothetical protein [Caldicellulosiruptor changbaiensis]AZT91421.1 hypothetical protein ELD05_12880 [Caldicellulosiruptor changbaiensis]